MLRHVIAALALTCAACASAPAQTQTVAASSVEVVYGEWRDTARNGRVVPYKIYLPATPAPAPVVIFSHGLGGSREAATYLLEYLAENGFVAVSIQHPGSDESLLEGGGAVMARLGDGVGNPEAAIARFGDVRFAIDQLEIESRSGRFAGRFDLSRLGMSGHSYGALATLVAVGQRFADGRATPFEDPRIDAAIVYSPNAPRNQEPGPALAAIHTPILHFTGTDDRTPFDLEPTPAGRQIPFRLINGADQFLIVFDGGDHMIFSGRVQRAGRMNAAQAAQTQAIERESLTFWRAYLLNDARALSDLCALAARVEPLGVGEVRAARCAEN